MKNLKIAIFGYLLFFSTSSYAMSGNELYEYLQSPNVAYQNLALSYLQGVLDTEDIFFSADVFKSIAQKRKTFEMKHFCINGEKITLGQAFDIVRIYLRDHPSTRQNTASGLIRIAMIDAFPCAKNPK